MKNLFLAIAFLFIALSYGCLPDESSRNSANKKVAPRTKIDLSLSGEELFAMNCKICHGIRGNLELNGAKDLNKSKLSLDERIEIITNGKNAMTPFRKILSKEEIRLVAEYSGTFADK